MAKKHGKGKKADKYDKKERPNLVRDSFTMPEADYARIKALKARCLLAGIEIKKSEVLRAGLLALEQLSDAQLQKLAAAVEKIKTGRPSGPDKS
jgi:hypothetical protein